VKVEELDKDALTELFNIGLHRAASSLSDLTGQRIVVDLPRLWICPIEETHARLIDLLDGDLATVHQIFRGTVTGDAVLVLDYESATRLAALMTGAASRSAGGSTSRARGARRGGERHPELLPQLVRRHAAGRGVVLGAAMHVESLEGLLARCGSTART
jgi:chemotaxis protein CheC